MRTRLVRVRRRSGTVVRAVVFLAAAAAVYIRVSLPALNRMEEAATGALSRGERTTQEIAIAPLEAHLISFGGFEEMSGARVEAARYVSRGAAGYVLTGEEMQVIGAAYDSEAAAERVCAQLKAAEGMDCTVISVNSPEVILRMTADSGQIAAFTEAEKTLRTAADALGMLAFSIDRGEADAHQAGMVIETQLDKAENALHALQAQPGKSGGLYTELTQLMTDLCGQMEQMLSETSGMILSSRLKYAQVDFRVREIDMMNDIIG